MADPKETVDALFKSRDLQLQALQNHKTTAERLQIIGVTLLALFAGIVARHDYAPSKWETVSPRYGEWRTRMRDMGAFELRLRDLERETQRARAETAPIVAPLVGGDPKLEPGKLTVRRMVDVVAKRHGFDPVALHELAELNAEIAVAYSGQTVLALKSVQKPTGLIAFIGLPTLSPAERLEQLIKRCPTLQSRLPARHDALRVNELVLRIAEEIREEVQRHPDLTRMAAGVLQVPNWESWPVLAWRNLADSDSRLLHTLLEEMGSDGTALHRRLEPDKPVLAAVQLVDEFMHSRGEEVKKANDKVVSLWSIDISLPKEGTLVLAPFLIIIGVTMTVAAKLQRRLAMIRSAALETRIESHLKVSLGGSTVGSEVLNRRNARDYVFAGEWGKLFEDHPDVFTDFFFVLCGNVLAGYLTFRWYRLIFHDRPEAYFPWNALLLGLFGMLALGSFFASMRIRKQVLDHALQSAQKSIHAEH